MTTRKLLLLSATLGLAAPVFADPYVVKIDDTVAPPAPPAAEIQTVAPGPGYMWVPGYWQAEANRQVWIPGRWVVERPVVYYRADPNLEPRDQSYYLARDPRKVAYRYRSAEMDDDWRDPYGR